MSDNTKYKHIFIAYASIDEAAYDTLMSHLNILESNHNVEIWSKVKFNPGLELEEDIQAQLQKTDMVILLISVDLINSPAYKIIEDTVKESVTIVPILLRNCDLGDDYPFITNRTSLPKSGYIIEAKNTDKAYAEIAQEIKKMVVGKANNTSPVPLVNTSSFWKKATLLSLLLIGGFWLVSSLFNGTTNTPAVDVKLDKPHVYTTFNPAYGTSIFTTDTSLFKILIIRFEDNLNEDDDTYCIGRSILGYLTNLEVNKGLPIKSVYADTIKSPVHPNDAENIQQHHNADVLIYGLANEIQENCTSANICFRRIVANTIMANLDISKEKGKTQNTEYQRISYSDIGEGKLSVDEQSMENWITGLVALKKGDKEKYFEEIEKMAADIAHLTKDEQVSRFYSQGNIYYGSKDYEKAIASHTKAIKLKPDNANYNNRGISYWRLKDYKRAILDFNKAIELKPNDAIAYWNRGNSYYKLKDYKRAILDFNKAIELKPDNARIYYDRGSNYAKLKNYKRAILDYDKFIELTPDNAKAYNSRGNSYYALKDYKRAIADYDKAIQFSPKSGMYYYNRAVIYDRLQKYEKANLDYDKALELGYNFHK